jgi:protein TonB
MSNPVIFKDLPATFPDKDKYQKPSVISSIIFHVLLVSTIVVIPMMFPQHIENWELLARLVSPVGPPPAPAPPPVALVATATPPAPKFAATPTVDPDALVMPIVVPKEIARIVDEPPAPNLVGVVGGVPGGVPGGMPGGILGSLLSANAKSELPPPPPPPPVAAAPAPPVSREPIRVGGLVKEPQIVKLVPPVYPPLASKARVAGIVVLEATLTADGTVEAIRVVSGHPLLVDAAINCVKQWRYEPTYLNGQPVAVILTAKVSFNQKPTS